MYNFKIYLKSSSEKSLSDIKYLQTLLGGNFDYALNFVDSFK